jgi:hypothetical protein
VLENIEYNIEQAERDFHKLNIEALENFEAPAEYGELRKALICARDTIYETFKLDYAERLGYLFDLQFGLVLYEIWNEYFKLNDNRIIATDDVWRYVSIKVIPDIVHARHGNKEDYYYKKHSRIWLRTIYYYIHLSWQGDGPSTARVLEKNNTDTIMNLVDRIGEGYDIELYREIMKQFAQFKGDKDVFRQVMVLNTAWQATTTPELYEGGIEKYVSDVFAKVVGDMSEGAII